MCYLTLGFNKSECALLGSNHQDNITSALEIKVQPHVTTLLMTKSILEAVIPPMLCFFLGAWSDKNGRRPVLLASCAGKNNMKH